MKIAFTGHRPNKLPGGYDLSSPKYDHIKNETRRHLLELKPELAISGMALGYDTLAVDICIELSIPFVAAIPFKGQELIWPAESQRKYNELIKQASEVIVVSEGGYSAHKMQIRNEWMINNSDMLIAVWDGKTNSGTCNAVTYATMAGKKIIRINPMENFNVKNTD